MSSKLSGLALAAVIGVVGTAGSALAADPPKSVRIGYAISLSGPNAQGAAITTLSGYKLWVDDVNKKGGLKVQGFDKRIPIEVVEYDDTSNAENAVRLGAARSLRLLPGFAAIDVDVTAAPSTRRQAQLQVMTTWDRVRPRPAIAAPELLMNNAGDVDIPRVLALLKTRNTRPMILRE